MRKFIGCLVTAIALIALPHIALAQREASRPTHEFGVDLGAMFGHYSDCTADCGSFQAGTPLDLRVGFISGKTSFEPRVSLSYISQGGDHLLLVNPDLNVLFPMGSSTAHKGLYVTTGAGINIIDAGSNGSANQFSLNGGVGTRVPFESAAWRIEGFVRYNLSNSDFVASYNIGVRVGLSMWH